MYGVETKKGVVHNNKEKTNGRTHGAMGRGGGCGFVAGMRKRNKTGGFERTPPPAVYTAGPVSGDHGNEASLKNLSYYRLGYCWFFSWCGGGKRRGKQKKRNYLSHVFWGGVGGGGPWGGRAGGGVPRKGGEGVSRGGGGGGGFFFFCIDTGPTGPSHSWGGGRFRFFFFPGKGGASRGGGGRGGDFPTKKKKKGRGLRNRGLPPPSGGIRFPAPHAALPGRGRPGGFFFHGAPGGGALTAPGGFRVRGRRGARSAVEGLPPKPGSRQKKGRPKKGGKTKRKHGGGGGRGGGGGGEPFGSPPPTPHPKDRPSFRGGGALVPPFLGFFTRGRRGVGNRGGGKQKTTRRGGGGAFGPGGGARPGGAFQRRGRRAPSGGQGQPGARKKKKRQGEGPAGRTREKQPLSEARGGGGGSRRTINGGPDLLEGSGGPPERGAGPKTGFREGGGLRKGDFFPIHLRGGGRRFTTTPAWGVI